jgi:hypothetical protein
VEIAQAALIGSSCSVILAPQEPFLLIITLLLYNVALEILTILLLGVFEQLGLLFGAKLPLCPLFSTDFLSVHNSSPQR